MVLDTDFLSSFLKIDRLNLVPEVFRVDTIRIPDAVYREVTVTSLLPLLIGFSKSAMLEVEEVQLADDPEPGASSLGLGERQAIALASLSVSSSILLMSDRKAILYAQGQGVRVLNIPAFLVLARDRGFLNREGLEQIISELREKDHYGFSRAALEILLGTG